MHTPRGATSDGAAIKKVTVETSLITPYAVDTPPIDSPNDMIAPVGSFSHSGEGTKQNEVEEWREKEEWRDDE